MTYSADFRWRVVSLIHIYGIPIPYISDLFGPRSRTIHRWYALFLAKGVVFEATVATKASRWPATVIDEVSKYVSRRPTFYLEELQAFIVQTFPDVKTHH